LGGAPGDIVLAHYADLLGWTYDVNRAVTGYVRAFADGEKVAGFGGPAKPAPPRGWRVYLATDDLDASLAAWQTAGGASGPVTTVADGRFAWLRDPWGCDTGLFDSPDDPGTSLAPGSGRLATWTLSSPSAEEAAVFYERVFGAPFRESVDVEPTDGPGGWVVAATGPPEAPPGDVTDPEGNVLRIH